MFKQLATVAVLLLGILAVQGQQYGVKGGYHQHHQQNNTQTGICYKRIPYHQAVSTYNDTRIPAGYGQPARPQWNDTGDGYVTIADCCDGYIKNPSTGRCEVPSNNCVGGCFGGSCFNGVCNCEPGWYNVDGICKPICRQQCPSNSYCFAPDVCECKLGWEKSANGQCQAICPGGCANGDCVAPQVCQCRPGYTLNQQLKRCEPICEGGCQHGRCTAPGVCTCDPGYINPPGDREICEGDCRPLGCRNGKCISPGQCVCDIGYVKDLANNCVSQCQTGCPANAKCIPPYTCVCESGFQMDYQNNRCIPSSSYGTFNTTSGGNYGNTGGYGNQGSYGSQGGYGNQGSYGSQGGYGNQGSYGGKQPGAQGNCERPCINGVCMGYNICSCNTGYVPDPQDLSRTRCIPSCPGGCPNGICTSPNFCICQPGYVKDRSVKGSQRCIPRQ